LTWACLGTRKSAKKRKGLNGLERNKSSKPESTRKRKKKMEEA